MFALLAIATAAQVQPAAILSQNISTPANEVKEYIVYSSIGYPYSASENDKMGNSLVEILGTLKVRQCGTPESFTGIEFWLVQMDNLERLEFLKDLPDVSPSRANDQLLKTCANTDI